MKRREFVPLLTAMAFLPHAADSELQDRIAMLIGKARTQSVMLPEDVALFIAGRRDTSVGGLEKALRWVIANARFTGRAITLDFAREVLREA